MPTEKKKRKYTFRKGQLIPYESGSIMHEAAKAERQLAKDFDKAFGTTKKRKRRK